MKKFFLLSMLAAATVSCTLEERANVSIPKGELVNFKVGVSTLQTKVTDLSGFSEDSVKSFQVFVFSEGGEGLEKSAYVTDSSYVEMSCFAGLKEVVAIVNAPEIDWLTIGSVSELNSQMTYLEDNDPKAFFMYGSAEADVAANEFLQINVSRRVARVVLKSVTNEVTPNSSVGELYLKSVYLINVAGDARYSPELDYVPKRWYNEGGIEEDVDLNSSPYVFLYDDIDDFDENPFGKFETYDTRHTFYCYPNITNPTADDGDDVDLGDGDESASSATRLVVEAELNDHTWYYPITIKNVESNWSYEIDLTIAGAGADSPDKDPQIENYQFTINVLGWVVKDITEEI